MRKSLYWKISSTLLWLLLLLGAVQVLLFTLFIRQFVFETNQVLNWDIAEGLVERIQPYVHDTIDYSEMQRRLFELMVLNPNVDIYLVTKDGQLKVYFAPEILIRRKQISVQPIEHFLEINSKRRLPIFGDNPRGLNNQSVFSAARIKIAGEDGYVYAILGVGIYNVITEVMTQSLLVRTGIILLVTTLLIVAGIGMGLFFILTKRLSVMTETVREFEAGEYSKRIALKSNDEITVLSRSFNKMADTIKSNIDELKRTDRLRRELVSYVSHDLRGPLTSIRGYMETIITDEENGAVTERKKYLHICFRNINILCQMVEELFELSKLEAENKKPSKVEVSLEEIAEDTILKFEKQAENQQVKLKLTITGHLPTVEGDPMLLERVFSNLVDNALRYTIGEGRIEISLVNVEKSVRVSISDTGVGIANEDIPYIFDRFYRAQNEELKDIKGTGLGLAIVKRILEAHEAEIKVHSILGQGTTFSFDLPVYST